MTIPGSNPPIAIAPHTQMAGKTYAESLIAPMARWMTTSLLRIKFHPIHFEPFTPKAVRSIEKTLSKPTKSPQPGICFAPKNLAGTVTCLTMPNLEMFWFWCSHPNTDCIDRTGLLSQELTNHLQSIPLAVAENVLTIQDAGRLEHAWKRFYKT